MGREAGRPGRLGRVLRQARVNAREHPYLTVLFGFWAFGYTMMVPQILGSAFLPFVSEQLGGRPEAMFLAFGALLVDVIVFALAVPFTLWMLICWAIRKDD